VFTAGKTTLIGFLYSVIVVAIISAFYFFHLHHRCHT